MARGERERTARRLCFTSDARAHALARAGAFIIPQSPGFFNVKKLVFTRYEPRRFLGQHLLLL